MSVYLQPQIICKCGKVNKKKRAEYIGEEVQSSFVLLFFSDSLSAFANSIRIVCDSFVRLFQSVLLSVEVFATTLILSQQ